MARGFNVEVDISRVENLAERLSTLDGAAFGAMAVRVVNQAADDAYDLARPRMIDRVNMTDAYVRQRMRVEHANSPSNVRASVVASGAKSDMSALDSYGSRQKTAPVNWSNSRIQAMGKQFGPWRGWTQRTGDSLRGIAPNEKAAGATVEVTRGSRKPIENGFFMPLRAGTVAGGNGMGLFTREGPGKKDYKRRYGPSVYQLFSYVVRGLTDELGNDLEQRLLEEGQRLITNSTS